MNELSFALGGHPTRTRVLEASLTLFSERGYHGTAVPSIAAQAGIAAGTMYRHFSGKEELVNELFRALCGELQQHLAEPAVQEPSARAWYRELWKRLIGFGCSFPRAYEFIELHHHAPYLDDASRTVEKRAFEPFLDFFHAARDGLRPLSPATLLAMVRGLAGGLLKAQGGGEIQLSDSIRHQALEVAWNVVAPSLERSLEQPLVQRSEAPKDWRVW